MELRIPLANPSNYARGGHVVTPWQPLEARLKETGITAQNLRVLQDGVEIPSQIDRIDPNDRSLDTLSFLLRRDLRVSPGFERSVSGGEFVTLEGGGASQTSATLPLENPDRPRRIELTNRKMVFSVSLESRQAEGDANCFAGAVQSFRLRGEAAKRVNREEAEVLERATFDWTDPEFDARQSGLLHDPEKRCMQVDRLFMQHPSWSPATDPRKVTEEIELFKLPHHICSYFDGAVRKCCTIVSDPFDHTCRDTFLNRDVTLECKFYRSLILFEDVDYVVEELWLKGRKKEAHSRRNDGDGWLDLSFSASYFSEMFMGNKPTINWRAEVPDWFVVRCDEELVRQRYGFATDVHSRQPRWPHPGYPKPDRSYRSFSWELHPCKKARCLHLFEIVNDTYNLLKHFHFEASRFPDAPASIEDRTGHAWYVELYKPLLAGALIQFNDKKGDEAEQQRLVTEKSRRGK